MASNICSCDEGHISNIGQIGLWGCVMSDPSAIIRVLKERNTMFDLIDIDELDTAMGECEIHNFVSTRECDTCSLDTCSQCVECEYCGE